jgi:hypothetical protein
MLTPATRWRQEGETLTVTEARTEIDPVEHAGALAVLTASKNFHDAGIAHTVLERNPHVGGTWIDKSHPGYGVGTPSDLDSLSFPRAWSTHFGKRAELELAAQRARVVINDLGGAQDGSWGDICPAQQVVDKICIAGGEAVVNTDDFADCGGAQHRGSDVTNAVDLGRLKGNRGDQQYNLPYEVLPGAVVIWCRAFIVALGAVSLA